MPSKYALFDPHRLNILPLSRRRHDMDLCDVLDTGRDAEAFEHPDLPHLADAIAASVASGSPVIALMGAHVVKQGLSRYVIDMIRRRWISLIAANGACAIHDFELARIGATSESVARYISEGRFGLWAETAELNDIITAGDRDGLGLGEAVGNAVRRGDFPHADVSIFAAGHECDVPITVHVGIGYDIIHEHPNFDAAATGRASYRDFLILAAVLERLAGGVVLCLGSAVMGPEVFLKALAMARNVAAQEDRKIEGFSSAVFDLIDLKGETRSEAPKDSPEYYFRPYKTLLVRTVAGGGRGYYFRGDHRATIPALHKLLADRLDD